MALLLTGIALVVGYLVVIFAVLFAYSLSRARRRKSSAGAGVIVVLGAPVYNGQVLPLLARRLDAALELYGEASAGNLDATAVAEPVILVSGGRPTSSSSGTEAKAMARYLTERGVPEDRVLLEEQSTTTKENVRFSKQLDVFPGPEAATAARHAANAAPPIVVVTSDFHVLRTASICRRYRFNVTVVGAASPPGGVRRSVLREYGLLLGQWWPGHIAAALGIAALLAALSVWQPPR